MSDQTQTTTLASGCFWCTEAFLRRVRGVGTVISGYAAGAAGDEWQEKWHKAPTYEDVSMGTTPFAEAVQITFNPSVVSFENLLQVYFKTFDPTQKNRQGNDVGTQYRSVIFYHTGEQKQIAEKIIDELNTSGDYDKPIVTELTEHTTFYPAEEYHQDFYERNRNHPYCRAVIDPKLKKLFQNA